MFKVAIAACGDAPPESSAGHVLDDVALLVNGLIVIVWNQKRQELTVY
jgi:hypothetical protein